MTISAALVKELRERTGSGMMECKKALVEASGDLDAAVEIMRKSGLAKADKKASRVAAEGCISIRCTADGSRGAIVELNCETDFVAKNEDFIGFANEAANSILSNAVEAVDQLLEVGIGDKTVDAVRRELVAKLGENINLRRIACFDSADGVVTSYVHGSRIGVLVETDKAGAEMARDIAMHIAASRPICVNDSEVSADVIAQEREIFRAQAEASGKPADIVEKMIDGRIKKFLSEVTLLGQPFVKDPDTTVGALLKSKQGTVHRFVRFEVGEGIEKEVTNFADEVMAQVRASE